MNICREQNITPEQRLEQQRLDAERYRYLRKTVRQYWTARKGYKCLYGKEVDQMIDEEMALEEKGEKKEDRNNDH